MSATATSCRFARADEQYSTLIIWNTIVHEQVGNNTEAVFLNIYDAYYQCHICNNLLSSVWWYQEFLYTQKAANAIMVKDPWFSPREKILVPSSADKWAVTVLDLPSPKEAP